MPACLLFRIPHPLVRDPHVPRCRWGRRASPARLLHWPVPHPRCAGVWKLPPAAGRVGGEQHVHAEDRPRRGGSGGDRGGRPLLTRAGGARAGEALANRPSPTPCAGRCGPVVFDRHPPPPACGSCSSRTVTLPPSCSFHSRQERSPGIFPAGSTVGVTYWAATDGAASGNPSVNLGGGGASEQYLPPRPVTLLVGQCKASCHSTPYNLLQENTAR